MIEMTMNSKRADGWWYPWLFVGGMAIVIIVNGFLVYFALGTWTGLESDNHYRRGLDYNKYLDAAAAQKAMGWKTQTTLTKVGGETVLRVRMTDPKGDVLPNLKVHAFFVRPTSEGHDFDTPMKEVEAGVYRHAVVPTLPGQWDVRIVANSDDGKHFQNVERLSTP